MNEEREKDEVNFREFSEKVLMASSKMIDEQIAQENYFLEMFIATQINKINHALSKLSFCIYHTYSDNPSEDEELQSVVTYLEEKIKGGNYPTESIGDNDDFYA